MTFDSNLAWKQASASIGANREVLLALAGVFFVLPSLAFALFFQQPQPVAGQSQAKMMAMMQNYYLSALPFIIPMALVQAAGTLAMLALFTDRSRPTVGEAIRQGAAGVLPYIAAQLLLGLGIGLAGGTMLALTAVTGVQALVAMGIALVVAGAIYVAIKTSLVAPLVIVERERNPVTALQRSWRLTKGNSFRIGLFYFLLLLAFIIISSVVMMIVGLLLAALAGPEGTKIGSAIASSVLGGVMTLYFAAAMAAVHRQLAGPSPEVDSAAFD